MSGTRATLTVLKNQIIMEHIKKLLVNQIGSKAFFRREKSEQYPDDHRNHSSVEHLEKLEKFVEALPVDHPLFKVFQNHDESESEYFNFFLSRFGFDREGDPKVFVNWVVNGMK